MHHLCSVVDNLIAKGLGPLGSLALWSIEGTAGYGFLSFLDGLFVRCFQETSLDETVLRVAIEKLLKPAALGGNMVEDAIKHEAEAKAQPLDVVPGADLWVDLGKVDDGEAAIGRRREKRKYTVLIVRRRKRLKT